MTVSTKTISAFRRRILRHYEKHGRVLPFRQTSDPYCITVSEFMLQQTQVERVVPKYLNWMKRWPSWQKLANSSRREVLSAWSGLGYNRRAIYLLETAIKTMGEYGGQLPDSPGELMNFPGIGRYTSRAILIFSRNLPLTAVDTNVRRVLIHELKLPTSLTSGELEKVAARVLPRKHSRVWHYALMDYGAMVLPRRIKSIPPLSKQSTFEGSIRQIRGEIIRQLTQKSRVRPSTISRRLSRPLKDVLTAVDNLVADGLVNMGSTFISLR